jgi:hypothetical protein
MPTYEALQHPAFSIKSTIMIANRRSQAAGFSLAK